MGSAKGVGLVRVYYWAIHSKTRVVFRHPIKELCGGAPIVEEIARGWVHIATFTSHSFFFFFR